MNSLIFSYNGKPFDIVFVLVFFVWSREQALRCPSLMDEEARTFLVEGWKKRGL